MAKQAKQRAVSGGQTPLTAEQLAPLIEANHGAVYAYFRARGVSPTEAEDLVQETFLRFCQARERFEKDRNARAFLLGIAKNLLRERARRVRRRGEVSWTDICLEVESRTSPCPLEQQELTDRLQKCLEQLTPAARDALRWHYREQEPLQRIGQRLQRTVGAVKLLMYRARKALKKCLALEGEGQAE